MDRFMKRRPTWFWVLCAIGVLVVVVFIFVPPSSSKSNSSDQSGSASQSASSGASKATVSGQLPTIQYVGQTTEVRLTVQNGTSDLPHLVVDASGCRDHWVLDGVSSDKGAGQEVSDGTYDFGSLGANAIWHSTLTVTPKDAGNHDCDIAVYGDLDASTGVPQGDPLDTLTGKVAINP